MVYVIMTLFWGALRGGEQGPEGDWGGVDGGERRYGGRGGGDIRKIPIK